MGTKSEVGTELSDELEEKRLENYRISDGVEDSKIQEEENRVLQAIFTRTSIRKFQEEPVSERELQLLLKAGFCAPSAMNRRPWHFVVIRDRKRLQEIGERSVYGKMIPHASCCIAVCGDTQISNVPELLIEDCAAAIQNILLAAHSMGLGAVWCGLVQEQAFYGYVKELLALPDEIRPIGLVALGKPAEEREAKERYELEKIHYDTW